MLLITIFCAFFSYFDHVLTIEHLIRTQSRGWMLFDLMDGDAYDRFTKNWTGGACDARKEREVAEAARQTIRALIYCHRRGIVHFDIKPQNLLFKEEVNAGEVKERLFFMLTDSDTTSVFIEQKIQHFLTTG